MFGAIILYTKLKPNMLSYEWNKFKEYAENHFKHLRIIYLESVDKKTIRIKLILPTTVIKFNGFFTCGNLVEFVLNNGYGDYIKLAKLEPKYDNIFMKISDNEINNEVDEFNISIDI